jgi:hypothetical protein
MPIALPEPKLEMTGAGRVRRGIDSHAERVIHRVVLRCVIPSLM